MAIQTSFARVEQIADQVGAAAALKLCAFWGGNGRRLYVPTTPLDGHLLEKIIGREAFINLVQAYPGEALWLPRVDLLPLQMAGRCWLLRDSEYSQNQIANLLGISPARVSQILKTLKLEGFADLAATLEEPSELEGAAQ